MPPPRTFAKPAAAGAEHSLPEAMGHHPAFLLARARLTLVRMLDAVLEPSGTVSRHFALGMLLAERPGLSQSQVSSLLGTDRTTTMNMAADLDRLGMIRRTRSTLDRRHYALHLTAAGRRWIDRVRPAIEQASEEFLEPLTARERAQIQTWLLRLVQHDLQRNPKASR